ALEVDHHVVRAQWLLPEWDPGALTLPRPDNRLISGVHARTNCSPTSGADEPIVEPLAVLPAASRPTGRPVGRRPFSSLLPLDQDLAIARGAHVLRAVRDRHARALGSLGHHLEVAVLELELVDGAGGHGQGAEVLAGLVEHLKRRAFERVPHVLVLVRVDGGLLARRELEVPDDDLVVLEQLFASDACLGHGSLPIVCGARMKHARPGPASGTWSSVASVQPPASTWRSITRSG